jgi:hypothetical protein
MRPVLALMLGLTPLSGCTDPQLAALRHDAAQLKQAGPQPSGEPGLPPSTAVTTPQPPAAGTVLGVEFINQWAYPAPKSGMSWTYSANYKDFTGSGSAQATLSVDASNSIVWTGRLPSITASPESSFIAIKDEWTAVEKAPDILTWKALGGESVTVGAGTFQTAKVIRTFAFGGLISTYSDWYAYGIGLVKRKNGSTTIELAAFSQAK